MKLDGKLDGDSEVINLKFPNKRGRASCSIEAELFVRHLLFLIMEGNNLSENISNKMDANSNLKSWKLEIGNWKLID